MQEVAGSKPHLTPSPSPAGVSLSGLGSLGAAAEETDGHKGSARKKRAFYSFNRNDI